ncbi:MAG TPA: hypothetical protein VHX14_00835 [Thermoanaerobaculia bacterium]|nr:hypothetical protein [Thermoanaerobaculia bacterium]
MTPEGPAIPPHSESTIFAGTIQYDTDQFGGGDPAKYLDLQHNTVAHESGHAVNLYHNDSTVCLMYGGGFTAQGGFSNLPQQFCTGVDTTVHCDSCGLPYPYAIPVSGFDETSTLRIKK